MDKQQTFDLVATHMLTQNKKSLVGGGCTYRGTENTKCAVGALIPDHLYHNGLEGQTLAMDHEIQKLVDSLGHDIDLARDLQGIHDGHEVYHWSGELRSLANALGLEYKGDQYVVQGVGK